MLMGLAMDEYILRSEILKHKRLMEGFDWDGNFRDAAVLVEDILKIKATDVAPVRHGRWVSVPHKLARVCSVCNRDEPYKFADIDADVYDYCPSCGAKMDGGNG